MMAAATSGVQTLAKFFFSLMSYQMPDSQGMLKGSEPLGTPSFSLARIVNIRSSALPDRPVDACLVRLTLYSSFLTADLCFLKPGCESGKSSSRSATRFLLSSSLLVLGCMGFLPSFLGAMVGWLLRKVGLTLQVGVGSAGSCGRSRVNANAAPGVRFARRTFG